MNIMFAFSYMLPVKESVLPFQACSFHILFVLVFLVADPRTFHVLDTAPSTRLVNVEIV